MCRASGLLEVAEHYQHFGGVSPINQQCRELIAAIEHELAEHGPKLPIYWGNRNWAPMLDDTLARMKSDGVRRALAFLHERIQLFTAVCRQYRENIAAAQEKVGEGSPRVDKLRMPYNHPGFIEANTDHLKQALEAIPAERRGEALVLFTAHSIPLSMAEKQSATSVSSVKRADSSRSRSVTSGGNSFTKAGAVLRSSLGWSRTFVIASNKRTPATGCGMSFCCR